MTYRISFTPAAQKQILRLDKVAALRIRAYVEGLDPQNPRLVGTPLSGESGLWRYRVGDYRILVSIHDDELLVLVVSVGHRRQVYRGL